MKRFEDDVVRAVQGLKGNPFWDKLLSHLKASLDEQRKANDGLALDYELRWGQGRASELSDFLSAVEIASKTRDKTQTSL